MKLFNVFVVALFLSAGLLFTACDSGGGGGGGGTPSGDRYEDVIHHGIIESEDAATMVNGKGTFNDLGIVLTDHTDPGNILTENNHFDYGVTYTGLYDIIDNNDSGAFDTGKSIRILHDSLNVTGSTGFNLIPRAMDLTVERSPAGGEVYIDPANNFFVLPRPDYWSKTENQANMTIEAECYDGSSAPTISHNLAFRTGKFGTCGYTRQAHTTT